MQCFSELTPRPPLAYSSACAAAREGPSAGAEEPRCRHRTKCVICGHEAADYTHISIPSENTNSCYMARTKRRQQQECASASEPVNTSSDDSEPDEAEELRQAALEVEQTRKCRCSPQQLGLPKGFSLARAVKELMQALPDEQRARDALMATADNIQSWEE